MTSLWFCNPHRLAGTSADAQCCDRAVLAVADGDRSAWWRMRLAMRTAEERNEIAMWRLDIPRMLWSLARRTAERGGRWVSSQ